MFDVVDFIFSYDLKYAFHHIEIFEEHQQYLGFAWLFEGKIRYFVVLTWWYFYRWLYVSKVSREFIKDFRSNGKLIIMFLDDSLAIENDYHTAVKRSREVNDQLYNFVFFNCSWQISLVALSELRFTGLYMGYWIWSYFCQRREDSETWKMLSLRPVPSR